MSLNKMYKQDFMWDISQENVKNVLLSGAAINVYFLLLMNLSIVFIIFPFGVES